MIDYYYYRDFYRVSRNVMRDRDRNRVIRITYPNIDGEMFNFINRINNPFNADNLNNLNLNDNLNRIENDSENVHDHQVQTIYRKWLDNIIPEAPPLSETKLESSKAKEVYQLMLKSNSRPLGKLTEAEILGYVYHKLDKNDKLDQLEIALNEAYNTCASGRATRVLDLLRFTNTEFNIEEVRPVWAIRDEILNKALQLKENTDTDIGIGIGDEKGNNYIIEKLKEEYKGLVSDYIWNREIMPMLDKLD